ncbi:MAG TPA: oligosaccharide flippase family protein [Bryobacteraceae bacterium]|nr:oligosaccharide flippase family protein [Bryobacteraceae bacterium]
MSDRFRRASVTTLSNGVLSIARAVVSFFTISMLVRYLGRESYGLCASVTGVASWLSITQGGIGQSLKNDIIREPENAGAYFSRAFAFLLVIVLVAGCALTAMVQLLPWKTIFNDPSFHQVPLIVASLWVVLFTTLFSLVRTVYSAFQSEVSLAPAMLAGLLISLGLVMTGVGHGWSTTSVIAASLAANLVGLTFGFLLMFSRDKTRPVKARTADRTTRPAGRAALWFFVIEACSLLIFESDVFLVNLLLGADKAATFALHAQLFVYLQAGIALLVSPYWTAFGDAWNSGERSWLRDGVRRLAGASAALSCIGVVAILAIGHPLMNRWSHGEIEWNPVLALLIGLNVAVQGVTGVYATTLGALGIAREPARIVILQAVLNIVVCVWSIRRFGVIGAAIGSLATYSLTSGLYLPFKVKQVTA